MDPGSSLQSGGSMGVKPLYLDKERLVSLLDLITLLVNIILRSLARLFLSNTLEYMRKS
jgi:hypothetical protein